MIWHLKHILRFPNRLRRYIWKNKLELKSVLYDFRIQLKSLITCWKLPASRFSGASGIFISESYPYKTERNMFIYKTNFKSSTFFGIYRKIQIWQIENKKIYVYLFFRNIMQILGWQGITNKEMKQLLQSTCCFF